MLLNNEQTLSYQKSDGTKLNVISKRFNNNIAGITFFHGYKSDMYGEKIQQTYKFCLENEIDFTAFEYSGHGESGGEFADLTLKDWLDDCLHIIDNLITKPQIIVGSSMGGWLMLLIAMQRKEKVQALIGVAAAPDFSERLIIRRLFDDQIEFLANNDYVILDERQGECDWRLSKKFLEDGAKLSVLNEIINLDIPVRLLHGMKDMDVPYNTSIDLANNLSHMDVHVNLVKDGDHRLNRPEDTKILIAMIKDLLN
jgi:uncharacterized protein